MASPHNITVVIKPRPLSPPPNQPKTSVTYHNHHELTLLPYDKKYTFDHILTPDSTHEDLSCIIRPLLQSFVAGFNTTIITYGQTGSGKTYTIAGILPTSVKYILESTDKQAILNMSYLEVYGGEIMDLLNQRGICRLRGDPISIPALTTHRIRNTSDFTTLVNNGNTLRMTVSTKMNAHSSRSHGIVSLTLSNPQSTGSHDQKEDGNPLQTQSTFYFVDLAGSERQKDTGAADIVKKQSIDINAGLFALGNVMHGLAKKEGFIRYRDHTITRLLKNSFGGNAMTLFFACVSQSIENAAQSKSTLDYALKAMSIKNRATVNTRPLIAATLTQTPSAPYPQNPQNPQNAQKNHNKALSEKDREITGLLSLVEELRQRNNVLRQTKNKDSPYSSDGNASSPSNTVMINQFSVTPTTNTSTPKYTNYKFPLTVEEGINDKMDIINEEYDDLPFNDSVQSLVTHAYTKYTQSKSKSSTPKSAQSALPPLSSNHKSEHTKSASTQLPFQYNRHSHNGTANHTIDSPYSSDGNASSPSNTVMINQSSVTPTTNTSTPKYTNYKLPLTAEYLLPKTESNPKMKQSKSENETKSTDIGTGESSDRIKIAQIIQCDLSLEDVVVNGVLFKLITDMRGCEHIIPKLRNSDRSSGASARILGEILRKNRLLSLSMHHIAYRIIIGLFYKGETAEHTSLVNYLLRDNVCILAMHQTGSQVLKYAFIHIPRTEATSLIQELKSSEYTLRELITSANGVISTIIGMNLDVAHISFIVAYVIKCRHFFAGHEFGETVIKELEKGKYFELYRLGRDVNSHSDSKNDTDQRKEFTEPVKCMGRTKSPFSFVDPNGGAHEWTRTGTGTVIDVKEISGNRPVTFIQMNTESKNHNHNDGSPVSVSVSAVLSLKLSLLELVRNEYVSSLATDPSGHEYILVQLKEASKNTITRILQQVRTELFDLSEDMYANLVLQAIFDIGDTSHRIFLREHLLRGNVARLSRSYYGSRVLKTAFDTLTENDVIALLGELRDSDLSFILLSKIGCDTMINIINLRLKPDFIVDYVSSRRNLYQSRAYGSAVIEALVQNDYLRPLPSSVSKRNPHGGNQTRMNRRHISNSTQCKPYKCEHMHCDRRFTHRSTLDFHMKNGHVSIRAYKCLKCSASYKYKQTLALHKRTKCGTHFVCEDCDVISINNNQWRQHRKTHKKKKKNNE